MHVLLVYGFGVFRVLRGLVTGKVANAAGHYEWICRMLRVKGQRNIATAAAIAINRKIDLQGVVSAEINFCSNVLLARAVHRVIPYMLMLHLF